MTSVKFSTGFRQLWRIGALRTHGGDAHGRERGYTRIDQRIASLAIHAARTVALFLIETWQRKFPRRDLKVHQAPADEVAVRRAGQQSAPVENGRGDRT